MPSFSPLAIAALIALTAMLVGVLATAFRRARLFRGYQEIEQDAREIGRTLKAEIVRQEGDIILRGNCGQLPTTVRFSHRQDMPGVNVHMGAPATFNLGIAPASAKLPGRSTVRTGNELLDSRFVARTDHPTQAMLVLGMRGVSARLQRLCCSTHTLFALDKGSIELSEMLIPQPNTAKHVLEHLDDMRGLAASLEQIPGAHELKIEKLQLKRSSWILRAAMAAAAIACVLVLVKETRRASQPAPVTQAEVPQPKTGINAPDAVLIPRLSGWRVATPEDFDASGLGWLRHSGLAAEGRIPGDFSGKGGAEDVGYVLINADGARRVVVLAGHEVLYDAQYKHIGIAARVPKADASSIQWLTPPPQQVDGDGLLITRQPDDPASGLVIFSSGKRVATAVPANYQSIRLQ